MNSPKVSIIVPNYNHDEFLPSRLESIFNQTFHDYEVILLDDASTDNSLSILKRYATRSKVSHFLQNKQNSGSPFRQWEKGIELARGEYIWVAESDDYCEIDFLKELIKASDDKSVLIHSASLNINAENEILGVNNWATELHSERWLSDFRNNGIDEKTRYLRYRNTIPNASAVIFKKSSLKDVEFPVDMKYCGDWFLWLEILGTGDIVFVNKPLNLFRRHYNTTRQTTNFENETKRFREYLNIIKNHNSFLHRVSNIKKYDWIIKERCRKKNIFGSINLLNIGFPIDFVFRYFQICKSIF